jgi:hypothetical protein
MNTQLRRWGLIMAAAFLMASCSATSIVHSWAAPGATKTTVKKVLVLGVSTNPSLRRTYEDTFSVELEKLGYKTVSGYLWAPDAANLDRDAIIAKIKAENVTHVLVTRLVRAKDVATYHAPTTVGLSYGYGPGYYGGWSSYYSMGYGAVVEPGYTTVDTVVTLETNFYDASKEKDALVWSGESATWTDQAQTGSKVNSVVHALVYEMRNKGVI